MKMRIGFRSLAALTLLSGMAGNGFAAPTVEQILKFKPIQKGVDFSSPSPAEQGACSVELEKTKALAGGKNATAWVLKDGQGRVLRKFHDTTGSNAVDMWSYYRDGIEAYREIDTNANGKADTYRWLNANGSKWGIDKDEDGSIDSWVAISAEEASQEVLAAVVTRDFKRLQALMLTKEDVETLGLPQAEVARIQAKMTKAPSDFQATTAKLVKLSEKTQWIHLETKMPQAVPADEIGAKQDMVRYTRATILYQDGDGKEAKHDWLQTGELILVGKAWRIVSGPVPGVNADTPDDANIPGNITIDENIKPLVELLKEHDKNQPKTREETVTWNMKRAEFLEQIAAKIKPEDRKNKEMWVKQAIESYASAAQNGSKPALERLGQWRAAMVKDQPESKLTAYTVFREMAGDYAQRLVQHQSNPKPDEMQKLQDFWKDKLAKYVSDYPQSEDTPDALMQLGMVHEFVGKETEAKNWYNVLVKNFPQHVLARKANGCLERIGLEGKPMVLAGQTLGGGAFNIASLKGKSVVVYYWASWNSSALKDFSKIKLSLDGLAGKVEIVCVNLDNNPATAMEFINANKIPGTHLHQNGGLESPLATQYGITVLPSMFLVGPDGNVVSRGVQANTLEDELRKIYKEEKK
jgi:hypothetical protein